MSKSIESLKLKFCIAISGVAISHFANSQSTNLYDYPFITAQNQGYMIKANGDSIPGNIYFGSLPEYVTFTQVGSKETKLRTSDIKKIVTNNIVFKPLLYKQSGGLTLGNVEKFVQIFEEGKYKYFRYFTLSKNLSTGENTLAVDDFIMTDKNETHNLKDLKFFNFSKGMSALLADYPELSEKIKNKEQGHKKTDLAKIIREYNEKFK